MSTSSLVIALAADQRLVELGDTLTAPIDVFL
jgi:hypothetical protein